MPDSIDTWHQTTTHFFRNAPTPEAKLWRYLSFAKFASLLQSAQLHFIRVDHFDDHFEGAWPKSDLAY
jgi:hypothetical protein